MTFEPTGTAASPRGHTTPAAPPDRSSATTPRGRSRGRSASAALADCRAESRHERKLDGLAGRTLDGLKPGRTLPQKELFSTHWSRSTPRPAEKRRDAFLIPSGRESKQAAPLRRCHRGISCQQKERSRSRNARAGSPQRRAACRAVPPCPEIRCAKVRIRVCVALLGERVKTNPVSRVGPHAEVTARARLTFVPLLLAGAMTLRCGETARRRSSRKAAEGVVLTRAN